MTRTLNYTTRLIRAHPGAIGSRWRVLEPGTQAILTFAYLHQGQPTNNSPPL